MALACGCRCDGRRRSSASRITCSPSGVSTASPMPSRNARMSSQVAQQALLPLQRQAIFGDDLPADVIHGDGDPGPGLREQQRGAQNQSSRRVILIIALTQCFDRITRTRRDDTRGVMARYVIKLRDILARPDAAPDCQGCGHTGFPDAPAQRQNWKACRAVTVRANWRMIFRFADSDAFV